MLKSLTFMQNPFIKMNKMNDDNLVCYGLSLHCN